MSFTEKAQKLRLDKSARNVKILTIDIERFPMRALSYDIWQTNIPKDWIIEPPRMSCFAAKWLGERTVTVVDERDGHEAMVEQAWAMLNQADIVVTYNGDKADHPWMREEFVKYRMGLPAQFKSVDLIRTNRRQFNLPSRSLQYFGEWLGKGGKADSGGSQLVRRLVEGVGTEKDWKQYRLYNKRDTELTESIYLELLPYLVDQPHLGILVGDGNQYRCAKCASSKLTLLTKKALAFTRQYDMYRCDNCAALNRTQFLTGQAQFTRPIR